MTENASWLLNDKLSLFSWLFTDYSFCEQVKSIQLPPLPLTRGRYRKEAENERIRRR